MLLEFNIDVLKVLGYGLSGFAFLLMFFAYMLLRQVISKDKETNRMIYKSIWGFMALSFLMTICVGLFSFFVNDYKENKLEQQGESIDMLVDIGRIDSVYSEAVASNSLDDTSDFKKIEDEQVKILNDLENKIDNSSATTDEKQEFKSMKDSLVLVTTKLANPGLSTRQRDSLKARHIFLNRDLSRFTKKVATKTVTAGDYRSVKRNPLR